MENKSTKKGKPLAYGIKSAVVLLLILATAILGIIFMTACVGDEGAERTFYKINGVLDTDEMILSATEEVTYVNSGEGILSSVQFHLYAAAYRQNAEYPPFESKDLGSAYPNGVGYGGITINSVSVFGTAATFESDIDALGALTVNNASADAPKSYYYGIGGEDEDMLIVQGVSLDPGDSAQINIDFTVDIPNVRHRLGYIETTVNLANFYPAIAIYEDGEWRNDPYFSYGDPFYSEVADYEVTLTAPTDWIVASTGSTLTTINGEETTTVMKAENVRDFAMVVSSNMTMLEKSVGSTKVRYYYTADFTAADRLDIAVKAVSTFNRLFGDYVYPQLSIVQTNLLQGGMEYPQLAMVSNELTGELYENALIHEIAHQWWYAIVGSDQLNDAWLDEALAEYSTALFYRENPEYEVVFEDVIADAMKAYVLFEDVYAVQIAGNCSLSRNLSEFFNATDYVYHTYVKGEIMFDSLRHLIGDEKFMGALKSYYEDNKFGIATPEDLIGAFEKSSKINLQPFFNSWINGSVEISANSPM